MSNVPSHSRTRRSHRHGVTAGGSRRTHQHSGYLPPLEGAAEVYEQIAIDEAGQVTAGMMSPGAVTGAAFAATISPVRLVHGLPTLPDVEYPEDSFVYDIDASPKSLWKNEADVWVKAIGPDDIQANSITAGQIAAGAVSTDELAVGARLTGELANEAGATPGVFIDSTGILIRDGKLQLEDEFGSTTMEASGFSGSWSDFVALGLYNARFLAGTVGAVGAGRTAALPYWTVVLVGSPVVSFLSGGGVRVALATGDSSATFISDPVPMAGLSSYEYGANISWREDAGTITVRLWYETSEDDTFAFTTDSVVEPGSIVGTGSESLQAVDSVRDRFARLVIEVAIVGATADPDNKVEISEVWLKESAEYLGPARLGGESEPLVVNEFVDPAVVVNTNMQVDGFLRHGGAVFPSATAGDLWFRTDLKMWFAYDGTRWVSTQLFTATYNMGTVQPFSATSSSQYLTLAQEQGSDIWVEDSLITFFVASGGTALSGSHKWVITATRLPSSTAIGGTLLSIDSGASNAWRVGALDTIDELMGGTDAVIRLTVTKTGTPGNLTMLCHVNYRIVAT